MANDPPEGFSWNKYGGLCCELRGAGVKTLVEQRVMTASAYRHICTCTYACWPVFRRVVHEALVPEDSEITYVDGEERVAVRFDALSTWSSRSGMAELLRLDRIYRKHADLVARGER